MTTGNFYSKRCSSLFLSKNLASGINWSIEWIGLTLLKMKLPLKSVVSPSNIDRPFLRLSVIYYLIIFYLSWSSISWLVFKFESVKFLSFNSSSSIYIFFLFLRFVTLSSVSSNYILEESYGRGIKSKATSSILSFCV